MSNQNKDNLKPCPFCGDDAYIDSYGPDESIYREGGDGKSYFAECTHCGAKVAGTHSTEAAAITAWNARPETPTQKTHESPVGGVEEIKLSVWQKYLTDAGYRTNELPMTDSFKMGWDEGMKFARGPVNAAEIERLREAVEQSIIVTDDMHETNVGSAHGFNLKCSYQKQARQALSHKEEG